jgi:hypothetical protein
LFLVEISQERGPFSTSARFQHETAVTLLDLMRGVFNQVLAEKSLTRVSYTGKSFRQEIESVLSRFQAEVIDRLSVAAKAPGAEAASIFLEIEQNLGAAVFRMDELCTELLE